MSERRPLSKRMTELLDEQRDLFNTKFRMRTSQGQRLDAEEWLRHVRDRIAIIVDAVDSHFPERAKLTLSELYDISLDLFAVGQLGHDGSSIPLLRVWDELLPSLGNVLARDPRRVVGSLCNAALHISQSTTDTANVWIECMKTVAPLTDSVDQLLAVGKVSAWRAGQAEYRDSALTIAAGLPAKLLVKILGDACNVAESNIHSLLERMREHPWILNLSETNKTIQLAKVGGSFAGFGGVFFHPPQVYDVDGSLCITDRKQVWRLNADPFGFRLHRLEIDPAGLKSNRKSGGPKLSKDGTLSWDGHVLERPDLANATSSAFDGITFAVTIPTSFQIYLFTR